MIMKRQVLLCLVAIASVLSAQVDDSMKALSEDFGSSFTSISSAHNHKVDWMFVVDHGGFTTGNLHLEYTRNLVQQLARHLYISPMHSQAGVITYGSSAVTQIPLNIAEGNQCDFNKQVNKLNLTYGTPNMELAFKTAINELKTKGRDNAHKVIVLISTASWSNAGINPYAIKDEAKKIGTLMVVVPVFNRADSIVAPIILSFASERPPGFTTSTNSAIAKHKYAFEIDAKRGNLRRLYRHFVLAVEEMPYLPLQVPKAHCSPCAAREACVCDVNLYNTFHCEQDSNEPLITNGCPADIIAESEVGQPTARVAWRPAIAVDYSSSMQSTVLVKAPTSSINRAISVRGINGSHVDNSFPIGKTLVTHRFADSGGNSVNCSFSVTVEDKETPQIKNCPASTVHDNATSLMAKKMVYWPQVVASDNSQATPTSKIYINQVPQASGARLYFAIGTSAVRIDFTDPSGNFATCQFSVIVKDYEPPVVQRCDGPNSTIFSSDTQANVTWEEPQFIDNSGLPVNITGDQKPGFFRIGTHTVTYTARDTVGNAANCSFTFTVRGFPCPQLPAPTNGAVVCDNAVPGATCQIFCKDPFDFETITGVPKLPEKYSCIGKGIWYPTDHVPNCVVKQGVFKKLPKTYYFDGPCSKNQVSLAIQNNAVKHYEGFVEGRYFKEAWGRAIGVQDFNNPVCGAGSDSTITPGSTPATNAVVG